MSWRIEQTGIRDAVRRYVADLMNEEHVQAPASLLALDVERVTFDQTRRYILLCIDNLPARWNGVRVMASGRLERDSSVVNVEVVGMSLFLDPVMSLCGIPSEGGDDEPGPDSEQCGARDPGSAV